MNPFNIRNKEDRANTFSTEELLRVQPVCDELKKMGYDMDLLWEYPPFWKETLKQKEKK